MSENIFQYSNLYEIVNKTNKYEIVKNSIQFQHFIKQCIFNQLKSRSTDSTPVL